MYSQDYNGSLPGPTPGGQTVNVWDPDFLRVKLQFFHIWRSRFQAGKRQGIASAGNKKVEQ